MNTESQPEEREACNIALEALLRQPTAQIEDAGFTACVMAALPQRAVQPTTIPDTIRTTPAADLVRKVVLAGSSAIGLILASFYLPWTKLGPLWDAHQPDTTSAESWLAVLTVLATLAWTATNALSDEPETL